MVSTDGNGPAMLPFLWKREWVPFSTVGHVSDGKAAGSGKGPKCTEQMLVVLHGFVLGPVRGFLTGRWTRGILSLAFASMKTSGSGWLIHLFFLHGDKVGLRVQRL